MPRFKAVTKKKNLEALDYNEDGTARLHFESDVKDDGVYDVR